MSRRLLALLLATGALAGGFAGCGDRENIDQSNDAGPRIPEGTPTEPGEAGPLTLESPAATQPDVTQEQPVVTQGE